MSYVMRDGDSVASLASRFGVSMDSIERANGIENPDNVSVGSLFYIPLNSGIVFFLFLWLFFWLFRGHLDCEEGGEKVRSDVELLKKKNYFFLPIISCNLKGL